MFIKLNGKEELVADKIKLNDLITEKRLCHDAIVVEYNFQIIPKEKWQEIDLADNDNVEIVSFVGGG